VFPFSSHNYLLRHLLAEKGVDPDRDLTLVVLPPPAVPEALASGAIDGFCAGEPWGSRAVDLRVGRIVATTAGIWPNHTEKVLAFAEATLAAEAEAVESIVAAVIAACDWLAAPEHAFEATHLMHHAALPGVPEEVISVALADPALLHHSAAATYPDPAQAAWYLGEMRRWRHIPAGAGDDLLERIWRPEFWNRAARRHGFAAPAPGAFPLSPRPGL